MSPETVLDQLRQAMLLAMTLGAPLLVTVLAVGIVVGVVQAATQLNEPTIAFVAKAIALAAVITVGGSWMLGTLVDFTRALIMRVPELVG